MTGLGLGLGFSKLQSSGEFNPALKKYNGSKSMSFAAQETGPSGLPLITTASITATVG